MASLDFPSAQLPRLLPLEHSYAESEVESDLKRLFLDLFNANMAADTFDVNVLGAAHLGSFGLVRRALNADGLVLMQGDREQAATRYLYRAWKSGNLQGRGLHFLRTYLQMLFPNLCQVDQLWHDKNLPYPTGLYSSKPRFSWWLHQVGEPGLKLDGSWGVGRHIQDADEGRASREIDTDLMYLTSRIEILLDFSVQVRSVAGLMHIIRSILPARLVPSFRFWLSVILHCELHVSSNALVQKLLQMRYPWCGRVVGESPAVRWKLGKNGELVSLPQPFGSFRLGEVRGRSGWRLRECRISSSSTLSSATGIDFYKRERSIGGRAELRKRFDLAVPSQSMITTQSETHQLICPEVEVSGSVRMLSVSDVWPIAEKLPRPWAIKLAKTNRSLDGSWFLGAENRIGRFALEGQRLRAMKMSSWPRLGRFSVSAGIPGVVAYDPAGRRRLRLNGAWRIGSPASPDMSIRVLRANSENRI